MPRFICMPACLSPRRLAFALLPLASMGLAMGGSGSGGSARDANLELCDAPLGSQVLQANTLKLPAAAIWLDSTQIHWPQSETQLKLGQSNAWRLLASRSGALQIQVGQQPAGQDQS